MSERLVEIPINKNLRDKIKKLKRELTYTDYLKQLVNLDLTNKKEATTCQSSLNPTKMTQGEILS